jgi:hypothetical protein
MLVSIMNALRSLRNRVITKFKSAKKRVAEVFFGRMSIWLWVSIVLTVIVILLTPRLIGSTVAKFLAVIGGGWVGFWFDRCMFPYARPDCYLESTDWLDYRDKVGKIEGKEDFPVIDSYMMIFAAAMLRRALLVIGGMIAAALSI